MDLVIHEIVNNEDFEKSGKEIETYDSIEELKCPEEYDDGDDIILDDLNETEMNHPRVQAMFERPRHNDLTIFIISQDDYDFPKRTIRSNGIIYHIFEPEISEMY